MSDDILPDDINEDDFFERTYIDDPILSDEERSEASEARVPPTSHRRQPTKGQRFGQSCPRRGAPRTNDELYERAHQPTLDWFIEQTGRYLSNRGPEAAPTPTASRTKQHNAQVDEQPPPYEAVLEQGRQNRRRVAYTSGLRSSYGTMYDAEPEPQPNAGSHSAVEKLHSVLFLIMAVIFVVGIAGIILRTP